MATFTALYDACVLYPPALADLLMRLARTDLFRARWTDEIHAEWIEAVLHNRPDLKRERLERRRDLMNAHVLDCLVTGYESLVEGLKLPDLGDRHVLAAAIRTKAHVIVTFNLRDFPAEALEPFGIEAQHPDQFVEHLIDLAPGKVCAAVKEQRTALRNPLRTAAELLHTFEKNRLPETVHRLREYEELL